MPVKPPSSEFLDRLAKLLAFAVTKVGDQVCATIFVRAADNTPKIYIAKNKGFTAKDKKLIQHLQGSLRCLARRNACMANDRGVLDWVRINKDLTEKCFEAVARMDTTLLESLCIDANARKHADAQSLLLLPQSSSQR